MGERFDAFKGKVKEKLDKAKEKATKVKYALGIWARENPDQAASAIGTAVFGGGAMLISIASRRAKKKADFDERECRQWDPVTGQYYYTKRPLSSREKLELSRRMRNGESKGDILYDMDVL